MNRLTLNKDFTKTEIGCDWYTVGEDIKNLSNIITCSGVDMKPCIPNLYVLPEIEKVIFNPPTTIVIWKDGTKTIVRCGKDDTFFEDMGLSAAIARKMFGSRSALQRVVDGAERQIPKIEYKNKKKAKK